MRIDTDTIKCISIAERPGTFGLNFHNKGYKLLGLNYAYLPLKVSTDQLEATIKLVKDNFHGCSVSMPHKVKVIEFLDELDESAAKAGAVNTILNLGEGKLRGYNTDYYGAKTAITTCLGSISGKDVLLVGAGGAARAIGNVVKDLEGRLIITNRTEQKARDLAEKLGAAYIPWEERNKHIAYLLIDATSVGMGTSEMVVSEGAIVNFEAVMDVVVSSQTELLGVAEKYGKVIIPGTLMTTYQAVKQFKIYTGEKLPEEFIQQTLREMNK